MEEAPERSFKELKLIVSAETLLIYLYWKLPFTFHIDTSDKKFGDVTIQNNKPIAFLSIRLSKPQRNYTTNEKEILTIVECLKQIHGILFGYGINVLFDHKNLVYATTLSESQRVMCWRLILEDFEPNIQHIAGVDNIVADTLSRMLSNPSDKYEPCPSNSSHLFLTSPATNTTHFVKTILPCYQSLIS